MIDKLIDSIQEGLVYFTLGLTALCIAALLLFDTLAGAGIMYYLSGENLFAAIGISLATSGLLIMLMVLFYSNQESPVLFIAVGIVFLLDVVFDSLAADVLRFGGYVNIAGVPDAGLHWMFRILMGGLSTVGDAVAMAIIVGMPVIKSILHDALPKKRPGVAPPKPTPPFTSKPPQGFSGKPPQRPASTPYQPQHKPTYGQPTPQKSSQRPEPTYRNLYKDDE